MRLAKILWNDKIWSVLNIIYLFIFILQFIINTCVREILKNKINNDNRIAFLCIFNKTITNNLNIIKLTE